MTTPTASSIQNFTIDELAAYYAPPAAIAPTVQPSADPHVYMNDPNYIRGLNKQFMEQYAVVVPNNFAYDNFKFALQNWNKAGKTSPLPAAPVYVQLDDAAFDAAWREYCANIAAGDPMPLGDSFIAAAPALPAPIVLPATLSAISTTTSPIGAANGGRVFQSSTADSLTRYPDGSIYSDSKGTFAKHVFLTPFGTTIFWYQLT